MILAPSRLTITPHRGALSSTAPTSGVRTEAEGEDQYWIAEAFWENLDARQWGEVMGALLEEPVILGAPMDVLGERIDGGGAVLTTEAGAVLTTRSGAELITRDTSSPRLDGDQSGETVATVGWSANTLVMREGEHLRIGERLHILLSNVDADSNGGATIDVWPPVEADASADIVIDEPAGLWRVEGDIDSRQRAPNIYRVSVTLVEDR